MRKRLSSFAVRTLASASILALSSSIAHATVVFVETNIGNFEINLTDEDTPETVANFLRYVEAERYTNVIVHRSINNFITQTGGYTFNSETGEIEGVDSFDPVVNEPVFSNVRGTIAMAKLSGDPDSATSEWFINLADNSANLDFQNEGFTVFGTVMGDGMEVIDSIADIPKYNSGGAFTDWPLRNDPQPGDQITLDNVILIESITVTDPNTVTNPDSKPPTTSNVPVDEPTTPSNPSSDSGGGTMGWTAAILALMVGLRRKFKA